MAEFALNAEDTLDLLASEIRSQRGTLMSAIANRRAHPSYGYTKRDILRDLALLEGMLYAYSVIETGRTHGGKLVAIRQACAVVLGEDIDTIRARAEKA